MTAERDRDETESGQDADPQSPGIGGAAPNADDDERLRTTYATGEGESLGDEDAPLVRDDEGLNQ